MSGASATGWHLAMRSGRNPQRTTRAATVSPNPHPPESLGEIEYSNGSVLRLADIGRVTVCGNPDWRTRRYVTEVLR